MSTDANKTAAVPHYERPTSRRDFLLRAGGGFGAIALTDLLAREAAASPLSPKAGEHRGPAKSVIFLFMEGGPSHIDLFDPKPTLNRLAGKPIPKSFRPVITPMGEFHSPLLESKRTWGRYGQSGTWMSNWIPHLRPHADDIAVLRSCICDGLNHVGSVCQMNTGSVLAGRPSLGAWATYGLGTLSDRLPSYVVLRDRVGTVAGGPRNWGTGFMPASYQGTLLENGPEPIPNLRAPKGVGRERQRRKLSLLEEFNRRHAAERDESELEARIESYELAFRMQAAAPEAVDLSLESEATREQYGLGDKATKEYGRACLLARRLVERGVRFVQVYSGAGSRWDAHSGIEKNHTTLCRSMDRPVAALLQDLKDRGLLDETLVVWGGEFGRTPMSEKGNGRDHNPTGFTMWFAGAGIESGQTIGTTDEVGLHAIEDRSHVHDIHATLYHLLGLDPRRLSYLHGGRLENAVLNEGDVIHKLLA
ncbi:MAG: DUF1501 domain-containing protein [Planctomycetota bacterium]